MDTNPILQQSAYGELGPVLRSSSSDQPKTTLRPSAETKRLVGELGLRFPPGAQADLSAHAALLALMAMDLAAVPTKLLDRAIREWAQKSRFMPRAAELIELASGYLAKPVPEELEKTAAKLNAAMTARVDGRRDIQWIVEHGEMKLAFSNPTRPHFGREIRATPDEITAYAKKQQASKKAI